MPYLRCLGIWLLILIFAILNGALREAVLLPALLREVALALSGVLLSLCVLAVAVLLVPRLGRLSAGQYWRIGLFWLVLTVAFEFGFGGLVRGVAWQELLGAYRFKDGNIWPLVLVVVLVAPRIAGHVKGPRSASSDACASVEARPNGGRPGTPAGVVHHPSVGPDA